MKWREFLKPDWRKIVIFLIIFFLLPYPLLIPCPPLPSNLICFPDWEFISLYSFSIYLFEITFYTGNVIVLLSGIGFIFELFFYLFVSYFLSCLIVWVYEKVKKK